MDARVSFPLPLPGSKLEHFSNMLSPVRRFFHFSIEIQIFFFKYLKQTLIFNSMTDESVYYYFAHRNALNFRSFSRANDLMCVL